jgi:hypothetical protein
MSHVKVSVTLEPDVAEELRQVAGSRGLSSFVNSAVRQQLQAVRLRRLLDDMSTEAGPISRTAHRRVQAADWPD